MEETEHMGGLAEGAFQLAAPCTLALTRNPAKMQSKMIKKKPHWSEEPLGGTFSSGRESGVGFSEKNPLRLLLPTQALHTGRLPP